MTFNFSNPYSSTRLPVFARNMVSTSHPLAAQAGLRILWQGGNAVDAAIAAAAVLTIVEPVSCGLGSDAFCILWDGKALHGLNASGRAPQTLSKKPRSAISMAGCSKSAKGSLPKRSLIATQLATAPGTVTESMPRLGG